MFNLKESNHMSVLIAVKINIIQWISKPSNRNNRINFGYWTVNYTALDLSWLCALIDEDHMQFQ